MHHVIHYLLFVCTVFLVTPKTSHAQPTTFEKTYDYGLAEAANCVQQTFDGGYILAGRQGVSIGTTYLMLIKTDSLGDVEWEQFYGAPGVEQVAYSVEQTADSGYIVSGYKTVLGKGADAYLMKTDAHGDTLWTKHYGTSLADRGHSVKQLYDGGYAIVGQWADSLAVLIRTSPNGDTLWIKNYLPGNSDQSIAFSLDVTVDSGFVLSGAAIMPNTEADVYVVRTDAWGDTLWTKLIGGGDTESGEDIKQTYDGGFIVTGYTWSYGAGHYDVYLIRMDGFGDTLWTRTYGDVNENTGRNVCQTSDQGYIIGGATFSNLFGGPSNYNLLLLKTDSLGNEEWTKELGGANGDYGYQAIQTADDGYAICGHGDSYDSSPAAYLIKTDSQGDIVTSLYPIPDPLDFKVSIYPNPMNDKAYVKLQGIQPSADPLAFALFDQLGRVVRHQTLQTTHFVIERDGLPSGIYIGRVRHDQEVLWSGKLVIQ